MYNKYKLAVFDLDGTILDTLADLSDSLNHILTLYGFPERTQQEVRSFVGDGIRKLIERAAPQGTDDAVTERMFADFKPYYAAHCADKTRPYEGITELIEGLRRNGMMTAVVSNKADAAVQTLCDDYFPGLFELVVGERAGIARKPVPDSVNAVLRELGVSREDAVYIGDSEVDIATSRNAQLECISVTWGFRDADVLVRHGAKRIVNTVDELEAEILG